MRKDPHRAMPELESLMARFADDVVRLLGEATMGDLLDLVTTRGRAIRVDMPAMALPRARRVTRPAKKPSALPAARPPGKATRAPAQRAIFEEMHVTWKSPAIVTAERVVAGPRSTSRATPRSVPRPRDVSPLLADGPAPGAAPSAEADEPCLLESARRPRMVRSVMAPACVARATGRARRRSLRHRHRRSQGRCGLE